MNHDLMMFFGFGFRASCCGLKPALRGQKVRFHELALDPGSWNTVWLKRRGYPRIRFMSQTMENDAINGTDPYLKQFERFEEQANQPAWLFPLRKAGVSSFAEQGFPTLKDRIGASRTWRPSRGCPLNP